MPQLNQRQVNQKIDQLFKEDPPDFRKFLEGYKDNLRYMITAFSSRYTDRRINYAFAKNALIAIIAYLKESGVDLNDCRAEIQDFYISILRSVEDLRLFERRNIVIDFTRFIKDEFVDRGVISIGSMLYIIFKVESEESVFFSYDEVTISLLLDMLRKLFSDEENKGEIEANYELIQEALSGSFAASIGFDGLELHYLFVEQFPERVSVDALMLLFQQACPNISTSAHKPRASSIALFCCRKLVGLNDSQSIAIIVDMFESYFLPAMLTFNSRSLDDALFYYFRFKVSSDKSSKMLASHPLINCLIRGGLAPELKVQLVFLLLVTGSLSDGAKENLWQDKNLADGLFKFVTNTQYGGMEVKQHAPFFIQWLFLSFMTSAENSTLRKCEPRAWEAMRTHCDRVVLFALCNALASIEHNAAIAQTSSADEKEKHKRMLAKCRALTGEKMANLNTRELNVLLGDSFARLSEQGCDELSQFLCLFFTEQPDDYTAVLLSHAFFSTLGHALKNTVIPPTFAVFLGTNPVINERVYQYFQTHMLGHKNAETKLFLHVALHDEGSALYHFFSGSAKKREHFQKVLDSVNQVLEKAQVLTSVISRGDEAIPQKQATSASLPSPDQLDESDVDDDWSGDEDRTVSAIVPVVPMPTSSNNGAQQEYRILDLQDNFCVNLAIPEMLAAIAYFASKENIPDYVANQQMDFFEVHYNTLKETFARYYELQADALTWGTFNQLLTQTIHSNLLVAQVVLGPVFRCFMQKSGPADYKVDELIYQLQEDGRYCSLDIENASYYLYGMLGINIVSHKRLGDDTENDQVKSHSNSSFFATVNVYSTSARQHWQRGTETFTSDLDRDSRDSMDRAYPSALTYLDGASSQNQVAQVQEVMDTFKREVNKSCQALLNPARASQLNAGMFATDDMPLSPPPSDDMLLQQQQPQGENFSP